MNNVLKKRRLFWNTLISLHIAITLSDRKSAMVSPLPGRSGRLEFSESSLTVGRSHVHHKAVGIKKKCFQKVKRVRSRDSSLSLSVRTEKAVWTLELSFGLGHLEEQV